MKKIITALLALLSIVSCTKESTESYPSSGEVKFTTQSDLTRASEKTSWSNEEKIGIYGGTEYTNVQYEATVESSTVTFTPVSSAVYYSSHTSATEFYAYYPYDSSVTGNEVPFDLATNQVDMLWSTASATEGDDVEFTFDHAHSIIELTVSKGADLSSLDNLTVTLGNSYSNGTLDVEDGTVTGDKTESVEMSVSQNADGTATASVIVMAYDYKTASKDVTINFSVGNRTFTQTLSPKWESGYKYKYSAEVGFDTITFTTGDITAWGTEVSDTALASGYDIIISADGLFQIYTAKGIAAFRDLVNKLSTNKDALIANESGNTYTFGTAYTSISGKLMNDINLEDICNETAGSWTPIGTSNYKYAGTFDGNGCEVQGLYINAKTTYQGLFGYIDGATIENLGVRGSVTNTLYYTSGLVGWNEDGTINLCYSAVTVNGKTYTGGVVGYNNGGTIINSYNIGSVNGSEFVGGVVGPNSSGTIANCYNMGSVSGTGSSIGGVAGNNAGTTTNCYSVGSVSGGSSSVGGVVGSNSNTVTNCYYNTNYYGGVGVGDEGSTTTSKIIACTSQYMKSEDFVTQLDNGAYAYNSESIIGLKAWTQVNDGYPVIDSSTSPTATTLDISDEINGTYYIYTATGLVEFRDLVNSSSDEVDYTATNAVLMANIDLGDDYTTNGNWTPIGTSTDKYAGTFDGNGFEVQNLKIVNANSSYQALFAYTASGCKIKNLGVSGSVSSTTIYVAGLVAHNTGTITNCYSSVKAETSYADDDSGYIGGVSGYNNGGTINNCYNTGNITASNAGRVGGVVGYNNSGTITNCYNTAAVSGGCFVGGLVGTSYNNSSVVANCYNSGTVTLYGSSGMSTYNSAGGIVGYNYSSAKITACYNSGTMVDSSSGNTGNVGSVAGYNNATITYCYYNGTAVGEGSVTSDCEAVEDMTALAFLGKMVTAAYIYYQTSPTISPCLWVAGTNSTPTLDFESLATSN